MQFMQEKKNHTCNKQIRFVEQMTLCIHFCVHNPH